MWYGEVTVPTYLLIGCRREDASPRKRFKFCRGIYILLDQTVGCRWGKAIGSQGIAIDWVGGRYGSTMILEASTGARQAFSLVASSFAREVPLGYWRATLCSIFAC